MMKAIRGAITITENTAESIREGTVELLNAIMIANDLVAEEIVQVIFSATKDLNAAYPAKFARELGWDNVPLFCVQEMNVVNSLAMCLRVLITVENHKEVKHIYLKGAQSLRPDLVQN